MAREENTNPLDILSTPVAKIPRLEPDPGDTKATALYKAGMNNAAGLLEFGESPLGVAAGALGKGSQLVGRLIAAGFAGDIAGKILKQARAAGTLAGETGPNENVQQKREAEIGLGVNVVLPGLLAYGTGLPEMAAEKLGATPTMRPLQPGLPYLTPEQLAANAAEVRANPPQIQPAGLLTQGTRFVTGPEGNPVEVQNLSPNELTEFQRNAEARSRQTASGQAGPVNTVAAGLEKTAEPLAKDTIRSNGADWYKRGDYWVTDKPSLNMTKTQLKAGRGDQIEDSIVADLEAKQQMKEAQLKQTGPTAAQTTINDVTGVNRGKPGRAGLTGLALREIQERQEDARWGSPESEYGPNHAISETQAMKIQSLGKWLAAVPTERVARTYDALSRVQPIYPYDITVKQMLEDRLGIKRPEPPSGELGGPAPQLPAPPQPPQIGGPNAIPERGPAPVPVGETPGNSPAVGQGIPKPETPAEAQAGAAVPPKEEVGQHFQRAEQVMQGAKLSGNWTGEALKFGASLDPARPQDLARLKELEAQAAAELKALPKTLENFDKIGSIGNKKQWFTEALQAAEGRVGSQDVARSMLGPDYKPPFPAGEKGVIPGEEKVQEKEGVLKPKPGSEAAVEPAPVSPKIADDLAKDKIRNEAKAVSTRSAQEIKDELVFRLQEALQKASRAVSGEKPGIVQIDIPDDGSYHIVNTVEAINQVLDKARKIDVSSEAKKNFRGEKPTAMKKAEREAAKAAAAKPPEEVQPQQLTDLLTNIEDGVSKLFSDERLAKSGMTRPEAISGLKRLFKNRDPELVVKAIENSRSPKAALRDIAMKVPKENEAQQAQSRAVRSAPAPKLSPAQEAFNQGKKPAPATPEQEEIGRWRKALTVTSGDAGRFVSPDALKAATKLVDDMEKKYGTRNPNDLPGFEHLKRQEEALKKARENPAPPAAPPEERPGIGSRVTKTIDGVKQTGTVYAQGGDVGRFMVRYGPKSREVIEPFDDKWVLDKGRDMPEALPEKPLAMGDFMQEVRKASKIKNPDLLSAFSKTLDRVVPGFMERARAAAERLQNAMRQEGSEPAPYRISYSLEGDQALLNNLIESVSKAAKEQEFLNREYKRGSEGGAEDALNLAKQVIEKAEQRGRSSSAMGITPQPPEWLRKFAEEEVAPAVRAGVNVYKATRDLIVNAFSPETNAKVPNVDILFEAKGHKEKLMTRAAEAIEGARRNVGAMSQPEQIAFVDRIKTGKKQPTPELQQLADLLRQWDDRLHKEASVYKPDLAYLDNHYRVLWKVIPGTADKTGIELENVLSKRPWRGSRGFTLQHTLEDMSEGIAKGGVPVSYNPVENFLLHAQDVMKFVSANRAWDGLKKAGQAVLVERGQEPPPGFSQIKDSISKQYFKTKDTKPGEWYVETGTARMINNFLSHDWVRQGPAGATGRFLIQLKNATTAIELGFSPFHAVFETNEAVGSSLGLSIAKIATPGRRVEGFKELLQALPGTVPIAGAFIPKTAARNILNEGGKIIAYAKDPEGFRATYPDAFKFLKDKYPGFEGMVDDLFTGGGVVKMQDDYHIQAAKKFSQAMADRGEGMGTAMGNYRVGKYAIPAAAQAMLKPIFEIYIPRLKVGTFAREIRL